MHTQDSSNILLETEGKDMSPVLVPLLSSVGASFVIFKWEILPKFQSPQEWVQLGGTVASISATMLGFMLAALAVLASINHTQLISMMRRTGLYEDLLLTLFVGCFMFLVCASFGYILLFGFLHYLG